MQFSLQHKENAHQIDVPITRKTSNVQNAVLADLLTRHAAAACTAAMLHFVHNHTDAQTRKITNNCNSVWPLCLRRVIKEVTRPNVSKYGDLEFGSWREMWRILFHVTVLQVT